MSRIRKKWGQYLRDKLGITEARMELNARLDFVEAMLQFSSAEIWQLPELSLKALREELRQDFGAAAPFSAAIHKNDLMFQHHLYHHPDGREALRHYLRVGAGIARETAGIMQAGEGFRLLDFGAGYGRVSRFLPGFFPSAEISISEIKDSAVNFQREYLALNGIAHTSLAESFPQRQFDGILALSVFTHLPQSLFESWFSCLAACLPDQGKLMITYNPIDRIKTPQHRHFHYTDQSEDAYFKTSDRLEDRQQYGLTYVSPEWLSNLASRCGRTADFSRQGFTGSQEVMVLS